MGSFTSAEPTPPDTVVLHAGIRRGQNAPSLSPFVLKLETYLRMANIPYKYTTAGGMGSKGKVPWIEYNGETIADSHFIIKYLEEKFGVFDTHRWTRKMFDFCLLLYADVRLINISDEDRAVGTAFRIMAEEFFSYAIELEMVSWNDADGFREIMGDVLPLPLPLVWLYQLQTNRKVDAQGIGAHSKAEIRQLAEEQLSAISNFLGTKTYFLGEEPSEVDCTLMGLLGTIKWNMKGLYLHNLLNGKFPNINEYLDRMKETFFPDWNDLISRININTTTEEIKDPL